MSHAETTGETRAGHVTSTPGPLPENTDAVTLYLNEEAAHSIAAALAKADEEHDFGDPPDWLDDARAVIAVLAPHLASLLSAAREAGREEGRAERGRLASALNVALGWHDGRADGSHEERAAEIEGCRIVLADYEASDA